MDYITRNGRLFPDPETSLPGIRVYSNSIAKRVMKMFGKTYDIDIDGTIYTINKKSADRYLRQYAKNTPKATSTPQCVTVVAQELLISRLTKIQKSLPGKIGPEKTFASSVIDELKTVISNKTISTMLLLNKITSKDIKPFTYQIMRIAQLSHPRNDAAALLATYLAHQPDDLLTSIKKITTDTDMIQRLFTAQTTLPPYKNQTQDVFAQIFQAAQDQEQFSSQYYWYSTPLNPPITNEPVLSLLTTIKDAKTKVESILNDPQPSANAQCIVAHHLGTIGDSVCKYCDILKQAWKNINDTQ